MRINGKADFMDFIAELRNLSTNIAKQIENAEQID